MKSPKPSKVEDAFWIYALRSFKDRNWCSDFFTGKWMIFLPKTKLDTAWKKITKALEEEKLGPIAKVSTARYNPTQQDMDGGVIVCYTNDYRDEEDLERVRLAIRALGFKQTLFYKKDETTMQGIYGPDSWYKIDGEDLHPTKKGKQ